MILVKCFVGSSRGHVMADTSVLYHSGGVFGISEDGDGKGL